MFHLQRLKCIFQIILFLKLSLARHREEATVIIADVNSKGYPDGILYEAAGFDFKNVDHVDRIELAKRLEKPEVQKALMKAALQYASEYLNDSQKEEFKKILTKKRSKVYDNYCSHTWLQWLPFLDCNDNDIVNSDKSELVAANNFDVIKERSAICYKKKSLTAAEY